jgi:excisionase family DNA binding protein
VTPTCLYSFVAQQTENLTMVVLQMSTDQLEISIRKAIAEALKSSCNNNPSDDLLTRKNAAKYLGVSLPTLNNYEKSGQLVAVRFGARVFFRKSDLLKK